MIETEPTVFARLMEKHVTGYTGKRVVDFLRTAKQHVLFLVIMVLCAVYFGLRVYTAFTLGSVRAEQATQYPAREDSQASTHTIYVDLSGSVYRPKTYAVPQGTRLYALIELAGGLSPEADNAFVQRNYNFSVILTDQQKVHIPSVFEVNDGYFVEQRKKISLDATSIGTTNQSRPESTTTNKISLNTANIKELESLPGVGTVTAERIIAGRPYTDIEDLLTLGIVKSSVFEEIAELIDTE